MHVLAVAQVEARQNLDAQILKQTVQPDSVFVHVDDHPAEGINARRIRIAQNHRRLVEAVEELKPDFVWQLEQDVELPEDCLERLIEGYANLPVKNAYISGAQVWRHGVYCIGAWHFSPNRDTFHSVDHRGEGRVEVDATGFYCLLCPTEVWLRGEAKWTDEPWGPDVNWGLSLREQGYRIFVDMDLPIGHKTSERGVIMPKTMSNVNVRFYKNEEGKWKYKT